MSQKLSFSKDMAIVVIAIMAQKKQIIIGDALFIISTINVASGGTVALLKLITTNVVIITPTSPPEKELNKIKGTENNSLKSLEIIEETTDLDLTSLRLYLLLEKLRLSII